MYNELDTVEFAVRVPTPVAEGQNLETLHYSRVVQMPASNQLFTLAP